ncbi:MAG: nitroreductase family protein [Bacteroidales bacterium]|nr:nitroreductase family protein [Bacteroidales bacterium]
MADNYLGNKMEEHLARQQAGKVYKASRSLSQLFEHNRSQRCYDNRYRLTENQLYRIIQVNTKIPSARNEQVLRFRPVTAPESETISSMIRLGGALPELHLPQRGHAPNAYIVICSVVGENRYVDIDLGIAAQSMLLKAVDMGLNGICIGAFDKDALTAALQLPYEPLLLLGLGKGMEQIRLKEVSEGESLKYYREEGIHYVPKIRTEDLII